MIVALDVGNTEITLAIVRGGEIGVAGRAPTRSAADAAALEALVADLLREDGCALDDVSEIALVSVVPSVTAALRELATRRDIALLVADSTTVTIPIRVDHPAGAGNDRLVNAFAAARLYGSPAIVVDLGTATTFDVVSADGAFIGGAIAPGVGLGLAALASETEQLPRVVPALPPAPIGKNTIEAIQSGAVLGYVGLVEHLLRAMTAELAVDGGSPPKVILTGGLSTLDWAKAITGVDVVDPLLTLRGLAMVHVATAQWEKITLG